MIINTPISLGELIDKISKSSLRVSSYGDIDELNSFIGLTRNKLLNNNVCDDLKHINESVITTFAEVQNILFQIGTELATVDNKSLNYEINSIRLRYQQYDNGST